MANENEHSEELERTEMNTIRWMCEFYLKERKTLQSLSKGYAK